MQEETTIPQMVEDVRAGKMPRRNFMKALAAMGISTAGVGAITAAATANRSAPSHPIPQANMKLDKEAIEHLERHDHHLSKQTQGDTDALSDDYADDAVVEDSMHAQSFVGRDAIMARKSVGMAAIPGLKINVTNRVVHGSQLTVEWVATGTHLGNLPGLPASGRSFAVPGVTVVVRRAGKIVREPIYYDVAQVHRLLGSK